MSQTVTLADAEGPLGTITLDGGVLSGSTRPLQRVADRELARTGSAGAAFAALEMLNNGYVWALRPGPPADALAPVLREADTS